VPISRDDETMSLWGEDGWAVHGGEGSRVDLGPHWLEVLAQGSRTSSSLGAFVFVHDVITANPPHAHLDFAKVLYVLEGEYSFRVGDSTFDGGPGTLVYVPRGSHHAFTTSTGGRVLFVCAPAGNEEMFLELGRLGSDATADVMAVLYDRFKTVELSGDEGKPWRPSPDR
jgi:mannose-6-phosphate isomerase-like protein (cupin superfamily)